jgi:hypothetical protein
MIIRYFDNHIGTLIFLICQLVDPFTLPGHVGVQTNWQKDCQPQPN